MSGRYDERVLRRRARMDRRNRGYRLWWLLLPGWRYRQ